VLEARNAIIIVISTLFYKMSVVHVQKANTLVLNDVVIGGPEEASRVMRTNIREMLMILFALETRGSAKVPGPRLVRI
jgi:hypothetical protein